MTTLYVYLGGWAFVLGMCLSGIAGAAGQNTFSTPKVDTTFELIASKPLLFAEAMILLWLAYSIPFVVAVALARWAETRRRTDGG